MLYFLLVVEGALNHRACWVTLLHPSGVASVPLQLGLGSPSLGRQGPRDMETDHMCDGVSRQGQAVICVIGVARHYPCRRLVIEMLHPVPMRPHEFCI